MGREQAFPTFNFFSTVGKGGRGREAKKEGKGARRRGHCPCPASFLCGQSRFHLLGPWAEGLGLLGCTPTGVAGIQAVTTAPPRPHQAPGETLPAPSSTPGGLVPTIPLVCFLWVISLCSVTAFPEGWWCGGGAWSVCWEGRALWSTPVSLSSGVRLRWSLPQLLRPLSHRGPLGSSCTTCVILIYLTPTLTGMGEA